MVAGVDSVGQRHLNRFCLIVRLAALAILSSAFFFDFFCLRPPSLAVFLVAEISRPLLTIFTQLLLGETWVGEHFSHEL